MTCLRVVRPTVPSVSLQLALLLLGVTACAEGVSLDPDGAPDAALADAPECTPGAAVDLPDPDLVDSDCDGIDGSLAAAILVAPGGADVADCGLERARPCRTIGRAIRRARELGRTAVYLRAGTYVGQVRLHEGIDLVGGYDAAWQRGPRDDAAYAVRLIGDGAPGDEALAVTLIADDLARTTRVTDVTIEAPAALGVVGGRARSSAAVLARGGDGLVLERVTLLGGRGAPGATGAPGEDAPLVGASLAMRGGPGAAARAVPLCDALLATAGGVAGRNGCPLGGAHTTGGAGGAGGSADTSCQTFGCFGTGCDARDGIRGGAAALADPPLGQGGAAGRGRLVCDAPVAGAPGVVRNGARGLGGDPRGRREGDAWWPLAGGAGSAGADGGGGGGGGGGSGGCDEGSDATGAGGGGGGAGGCAATSGGRGGGGGGGAFVIVAVRAHVTVRAAILVGGVGGAGGEGGPGGRGQSGGAGGAGGSGLFAARAGGGGGAGGHGGHGGGGGGGAGGPAVLLVELDGTIDAASALRVAGAGGPGGPGGVAAPAAPPAERDGELGERGPEGEVAEVWRVGE